MILMSAIKFHIDKTDEYVILCGLRHGDIFQQLKALGFQPREGYKEIEQGFITDRGEFLNRKEAAIYAKEYGQIHHTANELFSEDLW